MLVTANVLRSDRAASVVAALLPAGSSLIAIPLLARALTSEEFGVWVLVMTAITTLLLLDFGISASVMKFATLASAAGDEASAWRYWWTSCLGYLAMTMTLALIVMLLPVDDFVSERTAGNVQLILVLFVASSFLAPASNTLLVLLRALGRYRYAVLAVGVGQAVFLSVVITGVIAGKISLWAVLAAQAAQFGAVIVTVLASSPAHVIPRLLSMDRVSGLLSFGSRMMLVNLISAAMMYGPLWATSSLLDPREAGKFAFASTIAMAVRNLPLMSVAPIFNRLAQAGDAIWSLGYGQHAQWRKAVLVYLLIAVPAALIGAPIVGGEHFRGTGALTGTLILGYGFGLLTAVLSQVLRIANHESGELRAWVWGGVTQAALVFPLLLLFSAQGAAMAVVCGQAAACMVMHKYALRVRAAAP